MSLWDLVYPPITEIPPKYTEPFKGDENNTGWNLDDLQIGDSDDYADSIKIDENQSVDSHSTMTDKQYQDSQNANKGAGIITGAVKGAIDTAKAAVQKVKDFGGAIVDGVATTFNVGKWIVAGVGVLAIGYLVIKAIPQVKAAKSAAKGLLK